MLGDSALESPPHSPKEKKEKKKAKRPNTEYSHAKKKGWKGFSMVCLSAIGVVYGDIGTSPLYVFKSVFTQIEVNSENVIGITSLIIYAITLVVCVKYLLFVMRADHQKEGGVFALLSLILFGTDNGKHTVVSHLPQ